MGYYLVGFFEKGRKADYCISQEKPFEIDSKEGMVYGKVMRLFKGNRCADEWAYLGNSIKEVEESNEYAQAMWENWCKKHKRKITTIISKD